MARKKIEEQNLPTGGKSNSVLAREEDGTIQITVTIPNSDVKKTEEAVLAEAAKTTDIPGFRAGRAPIEEVKKRIPAQAMLERILSKLLPQIYQAALIEHKIRPVLQPQFQIVSAEPDRDWQIRIVTCEAPTVELGEYKMELEAINRSKALWTPEKGDPNLSAGSRQEGPGREEKEQLVLETLLKTTTCKIPKLLLDEEVNHRLAGLVDQTQKLGLTVDQYLAQTGKTPDKLKEEYREQARQQLVAVLALSKAADNEGLVVTDAEIEAARALSSGTENNGLAKPQKPLEPDQKQLLRGILLRRRALDTLMAFV